MLCATTLFLIFDRVPCISIAKYFLNDKEHFYSRQIVQNMYPPMMKNTPADKVLSLFLILSYFVVLGATALTFKFIHIAGWYRRMWAAGRKHCHRLDIG